jgi:uncharacterized protein (TIGR03083 family)
MTEVTSRPTPAAIVTALEAEVAALERELAGLSEADLARPSACQGWTNADVVAHLTWAAEFFGEILARALRDDLRPPDLPPPGPARRQRVADLSRQVRAELGGSLREAFQRSSRSLNAAFAALGPDDWDRPTAHRIGSVRRLAQSRLNELAVHSWDIRSVLAPPAHLTDSSLPVLIDLVGRWFELLFSPDPDQQRPWRLRFEYPGGTVGARDLLIEPGAVAFEPPAAEPADLVLRASPEVTILLAMGRLDPASASQTYGLRASGRTELLHLLQSRFSLA